jgi:hypothetical protein
VFKVEIVWHGCLLFRFSHSGVDWLLWTSQVILGQVVQEPHQRTHIAAQAFGRKQWETDGKADGARSEQGWNAMLFSISNVESRLWLKPVLFCLTGSGRSSFF